MPSDNTRRSFAASLSATHRAYQLARLAFDLSAYLRQRIDLQSAEAGLRYRLAQRDARFIASVRNQVEQRPHGPIARLLTWAKWSPTDIEQAVRRDGVDAVLAQLRDAGVYFTHAELTGTQPLQRPGLALATQPSDFDNTAAHGSHLSGTTSGSRSNGIRVLYSWDFLAEEAENEALMFAAHGVHNAPVAYWMPAIPALSGIHNLLFDMKSGRVPARWFAQVDAIVPGPHAAARAATSAVLKLAFGYVLWSCRRIAPATPSPEYTPLGEGERVARWLADSVRTHGAAVLKAYASAAVRVAAAARAAGIDLSGSVLFTGAEPLSERRRHFIESAGARAFPRYVTTETGLVAGACTERQSSDEMHLYLDRLAAVPSGSEGGVLFTTLSPHAGKVLLNADLGDRATLARRTCSCALGRLGLDLLVRDVRAQDKLIGEGLKVTSAEMDALIGPVVEEAGGSPDDYQFWQEEDAHGRYHLIIAVDPAVPRLNEGALVTHLIDALKRQPLRGNLTGQLWEQGATVRVTRQAPLPSRGHKLLAAP